jgi:hypothetical protein
VRAIGASAATSQQNAEVASAKARSRCTRAGRDRATVGLVRRVALSTRRAAASGAPFGAGAAPGRIGWSESVTYEGQAIKSTYHNCKVAK